MAIEGLDATPLMENGGFVPWTGIPAAEAGADDTLEAALAQAPQAERAGDGSARIARARDEVTVDLWAREGGSAQVRLDFGAPADVRGAIRAVPAETATASDDLTQDPLIGKKLTYEEIGHVLANRQYDSTDYGGWEEMSTGDWEWAQQNFRDDVYAGVRDATAGATSAAEAAQMAQAYLNAMGLGSIVHIDGSTTGSNDEIVITAPTNTYHPTVYMPVLWTTDDFPPNFDPGAFYDSLDVSAHTIQIDVDSPLTLVQLKGIEELRKQINATTALLNSLPGDKLFVFEDGRTISVAELRALWARADFRVTDEDYSSLGTASRPGAGAAHRNDGDPLFEVNVNDLAELMAQPSNAFHYILHELAHVTLAGFATTSAMYVDGIRTDPEFDMNEAFATSLAIAMGQAGGYIWAPYFLDAYETELGLVPLPSFGPPGGGSGGGGPGGSGGVVEE